MASPLKLWYLSSDQSSTLFLICEFFLGESNIIVIDPSVGKHHSDWLSSAVSSEVGQLWSLVLQKGVVSNNLINLLLVAVLVLSLLVVLLHVSNVILQVVNNVILVLLGSLQLGELAVQIHFLLSSLLKLLSGLLNLSLKTGNNLCVLILLCSQVLSLA